MAIEIAPRRVGGIIQLIGNSEGWRPNQVDHSFNPGKYWTGNPNPIFPSTTPEHLRAVVTAAWELSFVERPNDTNEFKCLVDSTGVRNDGRLFIATSLGDYRTVVRFAKANPELFQEHERNVIVNRASKEGEALYVPTAPSAGVLHNVLTDKNGDVLMLARSRDQAFHQGAISTTSEEQMDPARDLDPFNAAFTCHWEEMGIFVPSSSLRLLGVAFEDNTTYLAISSIANTELSAAQIVPRWLSAPDRKENTALFAVPVNRLDEWKKGEINIETWHKYHLAGDVKPDAVFFLHPSSAWRMEQAEAYMRSAR